MAEQALVSAIIIFYDAEPFLAQAIDSVLAQTYDEWELILVDDGSRDGGTVIARDYAARHPRRIRCLEHDGHVNRGMSASRNLGIAHARGKYIGFVDADDIWLPCKLEQQVEILERSPAAAMVYGRTRIWYSWTGSVDDQRRDFCYPLGVRPRRQIPPPTLFLLLLQNRYQSPTTCNALIRHDAITALDGFVDAFSGMFEDQAFFCKLTLRYQVYVAANTWALYRQHPGSCSVKMADRYQQTRMAFLRWVEDYLCSQDIEDRRIWRALSREFWRCRHPQLSVLIDWLGVPWRAVSQRLVGADTGRD